MEVLRQKDPQLAEFCQRWQAKYSGMYEFSNMESRATFYDAMIEMARHIGASSQGATVKLGVSNDGVDSLQIQVVPLPKPKVEA